VVSNSEKVMMKVEWEMEKWKQLQKLWQWVSNNNNLIDNSDSFEFWLDFVNWCVRFGVNVSSYDSIGIVDGTVTCSHEFKVLLPQNFSLFILLLSFIPILSLRFSFHLNAWHNKIILLMVTSEFHLKVNLNE